MGIKRCQSAYKVFQFPHIAGPPVSFQSFERYLNRYFADFGDALPPEGLYHRLLREFEEPLIHAALAATNGNQLRAAHLLGLNRNTLRKKIREQNIRVIRDQK